MRRGWGLFSHFPGLTVAPGRGLGFTGPSAMQNRWVVLALVVVARTAMGFQFQSVAAVGPFLVADLGLSYAELGTLIGLYLLPGVVLALPGGLLGARFGDRAVVLAALGLMTLGGAGLAAAGSLAVAAAGRLVSGAGGVLLTIQATKIVTDWFAGRELATALGLMLAAWPLGIALGPGGARHAGGRDDVADGDPRPHALGGARAPADAPRLPRTAGGGARRGPRRGTLVGDHRPGECADRNGRPRVGHAERRLHPVPELRPEAARGARAPPRPAPTSWSAGPRSSPSPRCPWVARSWIGSAGVMR